MDKWHPSTGNSGGGEGWPESTKAREVRRWQLGRGGHKTCELKFSNLSFKPRGFIFHISIFKLAS